MISRSVLFTALGLASLGTNLEAQGTNSTATALLEQFHFESKLWPNLHHFLYVVGRARNGTPDRYRVAVRGAPLDTEGFGALPEADRAAWEEALALYEASASPLEIGFGKLVDVNYAVADLGPAARPSEAREIPTEIQRALEKAGPVYRKLWWPRHDAANQAWLAQLRPQIEQYGPRIVTQLAAAFQSQWPEGPLRVEVVAYAQWAGAYTTDDPPLITMSSLNEEHQGSDGLEQLFHECSHLMMGTVEARLKSHALASHKDVSRDVSHVILFYTVGQIVRRTVPGHKPYADHYGVWERGWTKLHNLVELYWQPYLDGTATMDQSIDRIVQAL